MRKKLLYTLLVSCLFACSDKDTSYEVVKNDSVSYTNLTLSTTLRTLPTVG